MKIFTCFLLGPVAACLLLGCGSSPQMNYKSVALVKVSGTVTLDDKPLPDAVVKFEGEDGQYSFGKTNAKGQYSLQFDSEAQGVTKGDKTVRISTSASLGEGEGEEPSGEGGEESETKPRKQTELVPEKFNKESELKRTVKPDVSQTFDFDLKSK